jgi:hypothetical protein
MEGSNPSSPAMKITLDLYKPSVIFTLLFSEIRTGTKVFAPRHFVRLIDESESLPAI